MSTTHEILDHFHHHLAVAVRASGVPRREIAEALGLSESGLSKALSRDGLDRLTVRRIFEVAEAIGASHLVACRWLTTSVMDAQESGGQS